ARPQGHAPERSDRRRDRGDDRCGSEDAASGGRSPGTTACGGGLSALEGPRKAPWCASTTPHTPPPSGSENMEPDIPAVEPASVRAAWAEVEKQARSRKDK